MPEPSEAIRREAFCVTHGTESSAYCASATRRCAQCVDTEIGMRHATRLIEAWLRLATINNPNALIDEIADAIARGEWLPDPSTPEPEEKRDG